MSAGDASTSEVLVGGSCQACGWKLMDLLPTTDTLETAAAHVRNAHAAARPDCPATLRRLVALQLMVDR